MGKVAREGNKTGTAVLFFFIVISNIQISMELRVNARNIYCFKI